MKEGKGDIEMDTVELKNDEASLVSFLLFRRRECDDQSLSTIHSM